MIVIELLILVWIMLKILSLELEIALKLLESPKMEEICKLILINFIVFLGFIHHIKKWKRIISKENCIPLI